MVRGGSVSRCAQNQSAKEGAPRSILQHQVLCLTKFCAGSPEAVRGELVIQLGDNMNAEEEPQKLEVFLKCAATGYLRSSVFPEIKLFLTPGTFAFGRPVMLSRWAGEPELRVRSRLVPWWVRDTLRTRIFQ